MGSHPIYAETVLTCEGNFYAPDFSNQLSIFCKKFESLITNDEQPLFYVKVEPWNSIRVWLQLPAEASERLKTLANEQAAMLRDLGVLTVRIKEEDNVISFNLQSGNRPLSCSSSVSQDSAGSSLSRVNSRISLDSHRCISHQVSENSRELNILASQRSNTCRKTDGNRKSTLSDVSDSERCCNSETYAKFNPLLFHYKTAAETLDSNETLVTSRTAESDFVVSETVPSVFKSLMNDRYVASHIMTPNGFHSSHLDNSHKLSVDHLHEGRRQLNDSFQQNYKSAEVFLPKGPSAWDRPVLKRSECVLQSQVAVCLDSVMVAKSCESKTHSTGGGEHISSWPSDQRPSRKRKSNDLDVDTRLSVLPPVKDNCHRPSTVYNYSVAGIDSASEAESGTSISFKSLPQHSNNMRHIINPYTGEMENVPDDENLVMPHCTENAVVSNKSYNNSTNPATISGNPTFDGFTVSSNGHNVFVDADRFVSVDNFLQSILATLEASSSSDDHLLNILNSVVDSEVHSRLLAKSVAKTDQSIRTLPSQQMQAPQLNGIGHCMNDNRSRRSLSAPCNPAIGTAGNERRELDRACEYQTVSAHSAVACKGVLNVSGCHSRTKALQLPHSTDISSTNASSQMNAGQKFQKDVKGNLGNMVLQLGAEYQPEQVTRGMTRTTNSQLNVRHQIPQIKYQHQQVKDTLGQASHEFNQIGECPSGNAAYDDAFQYNPLLNIMGNSRTASSGLTSSDDFQQLFGFSEKMTVQMCTYRNTNGLTQNRISEKLALDDFQSTITRTDANSSEKRLIRSSTIRKEATSSSSIEPVSEVRHCRATDGNLLNSIFHHIPLSDASVSSLAALSAQPSAYKCPSKKSRPREQSKRTPSSVGKNPQASSLNNFVHGRQVKPVTKSQPTVAQLLDEARAKQSVSVSAEVVPTVVGSATMAGPMAVSSFLESCATGAWQKQMPNVALINLLPYSQPLSDFQCSAMEMLPLSLPRSSSSSVPSLIAVPLGSIGLTDQESGLQGGVTFINGDPSHHHSLSAFVFEQCQRLMQPIGVDQLSSTDVKQELVESIACTDSVSVKTESASRSGSRMNDRATATQRCDDTDSRIAVKQEQ